ncbi:MAG: response regulator [Methanospirillum sp.]|uniref:response regulator n=1 Tax=Methanospirillum sp. TaxID=45200 RepID=UPI00236D7AA9|nr:response regulator [Methanospirillum sp.]MDD1729491.1 response regulator [Methanospirillum sp.]
MTHVLIIDDIKEDRERATVILSSGGYQIAGYASDGETGISLYQKLNPDITLIDLIMPGINGIDTLQRIRVIDPQAKIILCTSAGQHTVIDLAMRSGAIGYVVKPYNPEILLTAIRRIVENV